MITTEIERKTQEQMIESLLNKKLYDIIVIGGGVSGSMAGIAAARLGAKVLVIEQHGYLGGALTAMGVGPMMSFHNRAGRQLVKGLPQELIDRLVASGGSTGHIPDSTTYCSTVTPFHPEDLKLELETMFLDAGGKILYHVHLTKARVKRGVLQSVTCAAGGISMQFSASVFIDATGDANLAARTDTLFSLGRETDGATQPMTMNFTVGNVDTDAIRRYAEEHPDEFLFAHSAEEGLKLLRSTPRISLAGYLSLWKIAQAQHTIDIPRDLVLFFETAVPDMVIVNTSRIQGLDATDPFDVSRAEIIGRRQCRSIFRFLREHCPGFENAVMISTAAHVGIRESRHVRGLYTLTAADLLNEKNFHDTIACGGYPIDIHSPDKLETQSTHLRRDGVYRIPLRCLLVEEPSNLVVVGRCISATHEASAAVRVSPIAMAIGQAGGTVAAIAAHNEIDPPDVRYEDVRKALLDNGAFLGD